MTRKPVKRILCPIDFSDFSGRAYKYAASLAQRYGAKLFVQHVVEDWRYPCANFVTSFEQYDAFCKCLFHQGRERLQEFARDHAREGWRPECVTYAGTAADCILSFAEREDVSLIVMGTHGFRGADRIMLGSVTEAVLRKASCPVLVVHNEPQKPLAVPRGPDEVQLHQILCCMDFSPFANDACEYALSLAKEYKATLTLVHVLDGWITRPHRGESIRQAEEQLEKFFPAKSIQGCSVHAVVRHGAAYNEIGHLACQINADLIVMAVRGRNTLDDKIFGSTTYRVIQLGDCPVLAIH
ncbi:MAG: universal stress protein [Acidobacteriaceae bacterium]